MFVKDETYKENGKRKKGLTSIFKFTPGMLTEESSSEVRKNMKVAFAEGYLAAEPQKQQSRTMRWIRNFQQVLAIVVFIAILFSLMGLL